MFLKHIIEKYLESKYLDRFKAMRMNQIDLFGTSINIYLSYSAFMILKFLELS